MAAQHTDYARETAIATGLVKALRDAESEEVRGAAVEAVHAYVIESGYNAALLMKTDFLSVLVATLIKLGNDFNTLLCIDMIRRMKIFMEASSKLLNEGVMEALVQKFPKFTKHVLSLLIEFVQKDYAIQHLRDVPGVIDTFRSTQTHLNAKDRRRVDVLLSELEKVTPSVRRTKAARATAHT